MARQNVDSADDPIDPIPYYNKAAVTYDNNVVSLREIARSIITLGPTPLSKSSIVLDNACGPGTICGEIFAAMPNGSQPEKIYATDLAPEMIEMLDLKRQHGVHAAQFQNVDARVMDSGDMRAFGEDTFTHVFMNFSLFFITGAEVAAAEIYHTLVPGGTSVVTTWALLGYVPLLQRAQRTVRPELPLWLGPVPLVWMQKEKLKEVMTEGGPKNVEIRSQSTYMRFAEWTMATLMDFTASSVMTISKGWDDAQKAELDREVRMNFARAREIGVEVEMRAWVAIAIK